MLGNRYWVIRLVILYVDVSMVLIDMLVICKYDGSWYIKGFICYIIFVFFLGYRDLGFKVLRYRY